MTMINLSHETPSEQVAQLRKKLAQAEEVLHAIRDGRVDALMVSGVQGQGEQVYTLKGADHIYRMLIETMTEGAVILSEDGTILYCNNHFARMVQTPLESVMGGSMSDFVEAFEKERFAGLLKQALAGNVKDEVRIHPSGGDAMPVQLSMRSLLTGEMKSVCMVATDLTQQKQLQEDLQAHADELHKKNTELGRRAEQLARLSAELTQSEQRERRRVAKILHDNLQQLLVCARLGLETLVPSIAPEQRQPVEQIVELLRESLEASRSLTVELCPPVLHEGGLIMALEWLCRWMKQKHGFKVDFKADPRAVPEGDNIMVLLFEAVRELLFNVIKHARVDSARVEMILSNGESLKIIVSDQGTGFDTKNLGENTGPGLDGFGLFSIRERLSLLGGRFEVATAPGAGTTVSLTAPLVKGKAVEPEPEKVLSSETIDAATPSPSRQAGKKTRVMLVDDHPVMRHGLLTLLNLHSDIETVGEAVDGEQAVHLARKLRPDVILMDISMPKMNGIDATRIIHGEFPAIRIIGLSMYDAADQAASMLKAGATAYLSKCSGSDALVAAIHNSCGRPVS